jgi:predicted RNase H-like HicB family nuclease
MAAYFGVIHKDEDSDYGISFPDFPGCVSASSTLEDLDVMAKEALRMHIEGLLEDKEILPAPSKYADICARYVHDKGFAGVTLVTVSPRTKRVRVNISLPEAICSILIQWRVSTAWTGQGLCFLPQNSYSLKMDRNHSLARPPSSMSCGRIEVLHTA